MIYRDIDDLNQYFWSTNLTYQDGGGSTINLPDAQILVENQPAENHDETRPFVIWTINPGPSKLVGISPPLFEQRGTAILSIFSPKGHGVAHIGEIAESLETAFREWRSADKCLRITSIDRAKGADKNLHQLNVKLNYQSKRQA